VLQDRRADFIARQILAELSGLSVNDTTQKHTARIIFGTDKNPQSKFVYTKLDKYFPGYVYDEYAKPAEKSTYRGEYVGEGGLVRAKPGVYWNVALLDVASMHPTSIIELNLFGDNFTPKFKDLLDARLAIKYGDFESARTMLDGKLAPYLNDEDQAEKLSYALKIVINIVYGLTSAKFDNAFRDPRNKDNIVAKRGALFMMDLKQFVEDQGYVVAHIKTDSIKIPDATPEIIDQVMRFGEKYGYTFEHEATYDRMALVNDAVYIAKYGWAAKEKKIGTWEAVGAQFQHPYVYKTLFTKDPVTWDDFCETKQVMQGTMFLDFEAVEKPMFLADDANLQFIGKIARFVPVTPESGGGVLYRIKDGKKYAVTGTKGFFWLESDVAKAQGRDVELDMSYFEGLQYDAIKTIEKFGNFEEFIENSGE
jgi:DNA polymerase elongation subunit (family B)